MVVAVVPGSFDPITAGHLDIIKRACDIYDKVIIGVVVNPGKKPLFTLEERVEMVKEEVAWNPAIEVDAFNGLLVEFVKMHGARVIIRGLRAVSDFEHEFQMAQLNRKLNPKVETIFMMASPEYAYLSSSIVKEIAQYGGNVNGLVSPNIEALLRRALAKPGEVKS
ncbi:MAG TPA: pantetheine-phosphate adenylyltransferase [Anaerolineae bacterium]|jgi:pantetheine-phosphate adenylyltransferase|nr:pantetheine-phosphate adenylyltransferase [Anaerolineae bacterium]